MSAPVQTPGDDGPSDGPPLKSELLKYAPKRARSSIQDQYPESEPESGGLKESGDLEGGAAGGKPDADPPRETSHLAVPPWMRKKQQAFAGDVATADLRMRLALAPARLPDPPASVSTVPKSAGRVLGVIIVATVGLVGYRWGSVPPVSPQQPFTLPSVQSDSMTERPATNDPAPGAAMERTRSITNGAMSAGIRPTAALPPVPMRQLTVDAIRSRTVDEPARLAISAANAGANATVMVGGLAPGSVLSTGTPAGPDSWQLSAEEFSRAAITPPRGFVGVMELTLELRLADNTVADHKDLQLEWSGRGVGAGAKSPPPPPRQFGAAEIALMKKNGAEFMANGNIGAARMMFLPAAEAGDPAAAFALAETYDPLVLRKLNAKGGISPDVALAQSWYEKARALGSAVAPERIERLARLPE